MSESEGSPQWTNHRSQPEVDEAQLSTSTNQGNQAEADELRHLAQSGSEFEFDDEKQRSLANAIFNVVEDFWKKIPGSKAHQANAENSQKVFSLPISAFPHPLDAILDVVISGVIETGVASASGRHLGNIPGGGIPAAVMADYLAAATNKHAGIRTAAPGAVNVESAVLEWAAQLVGYDNDKSGGCLTSGGSMASTIAFAAARDALGIKGKDYERCVIYTQINAHFCMEKGLRFLGLGECILRKIDALEDQRISTEELEKQMQKDVDDGLKPFIIVGTLGTTSCGAIDDMATLASLARRFGAWFHVDAAYGGFFILVEEMKAKMSGVEEADSIALDPHKSLFLPFGTGLLIVKKVRQLLNTHCFRGDYIDYSEDDRRLKLEDIRCLRHPAPSDVSPELTRDFRGLRVWLPLLYHGTKVFKDALKEKLYLARYLHSRLKATSDVEVGLEPQLSIVIFRFVNNGIVDRQNCVNIFKCKNKTQFDNRVNQAVVSAVTQEGTVYLGSIDVFGFTWIRLAILSFRTHKEDVDLALHLLIEARDKVMQEEAAKPKN